MPAKYRKATIKKNTERKKTRFPVHTRHSRLLKHVRRSRLLMRVRRMISPPSTRPLCITISTEGLTQEQIDNMKELERQGLLPNVTWIESSPRGYDDKLKYALLYLHSEEAKLFGCKIIKGYDYAWVKIAMDSKEMSERYRRYQYMSTPKFVEFIKSLGFIDIAGPKTINKALTNARWSSDDNAIYFHRVYINIIERKRRNLIASKFLEIMNEI